MDLISLPLLNQDSSVTDGLRAIRTHRSGGLVSSDGSRFWVHRFDQLVEAAHKDPSQQLAKLPRMTADELQPTDAVKQDLSFTRPNDRHFGPYLAGRKADFMITATAKLGDIGQLAILAFSSETFAREYGVYPKAWTCPSDTSEIWADIDKPHNGRCPKHHDILVEDK